MAGVEGDDDDNEEAPDKTPLVAADDASVVVLIASGSACSLAQRVSRPLDKYECKESAAR